MSKFLTTLFFSTLLLFSLPTLAQSTWAGTTLTECRDSHQGMNPSSVHIESPFFDSFVFEVGGTPLIVDYFYEYDTAANVSMVHSYFNVVYMADSLAGYVHTIRELEQREPLTNFVITNDTVSFQHTCLFIMESVEWSDVYLSSDFKVRKTISLLKTKQGWLLVTHEKTITQ